MHRHVALIAVLLATPCAAQTVEPAPSPELRFEEIYPRAQTIQRDDPFVISGDECGASRYQHLVGEHFPGVIQASLPSDTYVLGHGRVTTLEYRPGRINVTLGGGGQILAIGCF
jgi:hypothetical protein